MIVKFKYHFKVYFSELAKLRLIIIPWMAFTQSRTNHYCYTTPYSCHNSLLCWPFCLSSIWSSILHRLYHCSSRSLVILGFLKTLSLRSFIKALSSFILWWTRLSHLPLDQALSFYSLNMLCFVSDSCIFTHQKQKQTPRILQKSSLSNFLTLLSLLTEGKDMIESI